MKQYEAYEAYIGYKASCAMRSTRYGLTSVRLVVEEKASLYSFALVGEGEKTMHGDSPEMIGLGYIVHWPQLGIDELRFRRTAIATHTSSHLIILGESPWSLHEDDDAYVGIVNAFTKSRRGNEPTILPCLPGRSS